MCTSVTFKNGNSFFFGRNLDLDVVFGNKVTVTPRNYPLPFRHAGLLENHYAICGMAMVINNYPMYFDGFNEKGLGMNGLNFPKTGYYFPYEEKEGKVFLPAFEFIPYILAKCATVDEAKKELENIVLTDEVYNPQMPVYTMHWHIADSEKSIIVEPMPDGLKVYDDKVGVMTNNPPYPAQAYQLINYMNLTSQMPKDTFSQGLLGLETNGVGIGTFGLPGGYDSTSRFVRAVYNKWNSFNKDVKDTLEDNLGQFFRILSSVAVAKGCAVEPSGEYMITQYSSCCDMNDLVYYYITYNNMQINGVSLKQANVDSADLITFPMQTSPQIWMEN